MSVEPGLVSIITPCHDAAPFIAATIQSVMDQSYRQIEHIVVDDGSNDESWSVISSFGERIRGVRLDSNRGGAYARNRGAELARGDYLMFLDADDVLGRDTIAALVAAFKGEPGGVAACPWKRLKQASDATWIEAPADVPPPDDDPLAGWLSGERWVPPCAILWRRESYQRVGPWDETITANDDGELMMRAFLAGVPLVMTTDGKAYYRWHGYTRASLGRASFSSVWFRSHIRVLEKVTSELHARNDLTRYARSLGVAYHKLALLGFQHGQVALGRECLDRGKRYAGHVDHSRTRLGRFLTRAVGLELKERLAGGLAEVGIMSENRRRGLVLRASYLREAGRQPQQQKASASETTPDKAGATRVTVAVVTFRRPVGLARLLEALGHLRFTKVAAPVCKVLVVDNDPEGSAAAVYRREREHYSWPLAYVHEPRRGIAQARNAAVRHALGEADWLVFIDDDEIPEPTWLDELLHVQRQCDADVVGGPVVPMFQAPPPQWIVRGDFFTLPRYPTGTRLDRAYTGNVLVSIRIFREIPDPFDERLGLSGGEDIHFFRRVASLGYRIIWADQAIAHDFIPPSRVTAGWLIRRAYRTGNLWAVCDRDLDGSLALIARHTARSIARIVRGVLLAAPSIFFGRDRAMQAARTAALGAGYLAGVTGIRYNEYRTTHGV